MKTYTVVGTVKDKEGGLQPWVRHVNASSPAEAGIKGVRSFAKGAGISTKDYEHLVIEVFKGTHRGILGNWDPLDLKGLKEALKK